MVADRVRILIIEFHDEPGQVVAVIEGFGQLSADERQLKIKIIRVTGLEIVYQRRDRQMAVVVGIAIAVNREIDDGKEV